MKSNPKSFHPAMATKNEGASYTRPPFVPIATHFPKILPPKMFIHTYNINHQPSFRHRSPPSFYRNHIFPPLPVLCQYNVHLQPLPSFPVLSPPSPTTNTNTNINHSLPSRSMIPKPQPPKFNDVINCRFENYRDGAGGAKQRNNNHLNVVGKQQRDLGFEGRQKRWKNNKSNDYHQILPMEANTTSLMIKNIPNRYTRKLLIKTLDNHCKLQNEDNDFVSAYDFVYLPIDFTNGFNAGFAFVNFTNSKAALSFRGAFHGKRWAFCTSSKVAEISRARIQGKEALKNNCKKMDFTCGSEEDMPIVFEPPRNGSGLVGLGMYTLGKL